MYNKEELIIRELAKEVQALSNEESAIEKIDAWKKHNDMQSGNRPMILVNPSGPTWNNEIIGDSLVCQDPVLRGYENNLRRTLFQAKVIKDDSPITTNFNVPFSTKVSFYGDEFKLVATKTGEGGAFHYEKCIEDIEEDFHKLAYRTIEHNVEQSAKNLDRANSLLGDIMNVRHRAPMWWTLGLTWECIKLIGLEDLMMNMYDDPEGLHKLMGWLSDEHINFIDTCKNLGILTQNNEDEGIASGGIGYTNQLGTVEPGNVDFMNMWGFSESQETVGISPEMFGEFIFPYQLPLLEKFAINCYGCCEPVEQRWKWVSQIPRLRRVSVSPWSNVDTMKEILGQDYIYSRKPAPSYVCKNFDEDSIRKDLDHVFSFSKDVRLEVILKDIETVEKDPMRLAKWVEIAREKASKYNG